jgi:hypothetical protein
MRILGIICVLIMFFACDSLASGKIDTIYFQNGDRMSGEVKSLANNYLQFSTHDAKTIQVEWEKLDSVKILNSMRVLLEDGRVFYGKILPCGEVNKCFLWPTVGDVRKFDLHEIVVLSPLEEKFVDRLKGSISSGFSYTKSNDLMQLNINGSVNYVANKNSMELSYDGNFTTQDTISSNQHQNAGVTMQRLLKRNWFLVSKLSLETSSEQQLDLRTSFGAGGGKNLIHSNRSTLYIAGGLLGNKEESKGAIQYNLEGTFGVDYSVYIYDFPEVSFNISADLIPSLSDAGRVRATIDSNLKWEVFNDFYLKWTFYYNYDSRPLSVDAAKYDWAITLLGLEYKL